MELISSYSFDACETTKNGYWTHIFPKLKGFYLSSLKLILRKTWVLLGFEDTRVLMLDQSPTEDVVFSSSSRWIAWQGESSKVLQSCDGPAFCITACDEDWHTHSCVWCHPSYGPSLVGAFASSDRKEVAKLHRLFCEMMNRSPLNSSLLKLNMRHTPLNTPRGDSKLKHFILLHYNFSKLLTFTQINYRWEIIAQLKIILSAKLCAVSRGRTSREYSIHTSKNGFHDIHNYWKFLNYVLSLS